MKYGRYAVKRLFALLLALLLALGLSACGGPAAEVPSSAPPAASDAPEIRESLPPVQTPPAGGEQAEDPAGETPDGPAVAEDGWYSSKEEVALYIHLYGRLPDNYVTKREAQELGWTGGRPSAEAALEITRACCPRRRAGCIPNATSAPWAGHPGARSGWCSPTTVWCTTPVTTTRALSCSTGSREHGGHQTGRGASAGPGGGHGAAGPGAGPAGVAGGCCGCWRTRRRKIPIWN